MARLNAPNGAIVNVDDDKAARLGWSPADDEKPTPKRTRKAAPEPAE